MEAISKTAMEATIILIKKYVIEMSLLLKITEWILTSIWKENFYLHTILLLFGQKRKKILK